MLSKNTLDSDSLICWEGTSYINCVTPSSQVPPVPSEYEDQTQSVMALHGLDPKVLKKVFTDALKQQKIHTEKN